MIRLCTLVILLPSIAYSQAPFELANRDALRLTEARLKMLTNKEWRVRKVETDNRNQSTETNLTRTYLKYSSTGVFSYEAKHEKWPVLDSGKWTILERKYIQHSPNQKPRLNFGGTYAVTSISDTSLVLTKVLTSSRDMKRVIYLTLKPWDLTLDRLRRPGMVRLTPNQIDTLSRITSESLIEHNISFTRDSIFFRYFDTLYRIKRKPKN